MEFYDYDEIKEAGSCLDYAITVLNMTPVKGERDQFNIPWRPASDSGALSINETGWVDFVTNDKGSILDLVVRFRQVDLLSAQKELGEYYKLDPKMKKRTDFHPGTRYEKLISEGFKCTAIYPYVDLEGVTRYEVLRLEHPEKDKEFLQRESENKWSMKGVERIPYNLKGFADSEWVCIVEGEKDVETLKEIGYPATTNSGGSKKWPDTFAQYFEGKKVFILYDNDIKILKGQTEPIGLVHARLVALKIKDAATAIFMTSTSQAPKGDVTEYIKVERHTASDLHQLLESLEQLDQTLLQDDDFNPIINDAKLANEVDFLNYIPKKTTNEKKKVTVEKEPRQIEEVIKDSKRRFLDFPKKVGEQLFDHDRETGLINPIFNSSSLFSWMGMKSKRRIWWAAGEGFVPKQEFFEGILSSAERYESISYVPDWPPRRDVYYAHEKLPEPSSDHHYFKEFVEFFNPADEAQKSFLKAFIAAPLYYIPGIPKPSWIIDSEHGAGVGKTTLVEVISTLYQAPDSQRGGLVRTNPNQLRQNPDELVRRLVSSEGRLSRMVLIDNVVGEFKCPQLADMITSSHISGKAPYGRGEECRPNNLNYVITANSATVDNDIAIRSYYVILKKSVKSTLWKSRVMDYIRNNRMNIIADITDILNHGTSGEAFKMQSQSCTRFPEFEERVLAPMCGSSEAYSDAIKVLADVKAESNIDEEESRSIADMIKYGLQELGIPHDKKVFIQHGAITEWCRKAFPENRYPSRMVQDIRNMAKNGSLHEVDPNHNQHGVKERRRGVTWGRYKKGDSLIVVGVGKAGKVALKDSI